MSKVITKAIFKNRITTSQGLLPDMLKFHNIKINGRTVGCSGFLKYSNGNILYVNTEESCLSSLKGKILVRTAKDENDYCGGYNNHLEVSHEEKHDYNLQRELYRLAGYTV